MGVAGGSGATADRVLLGWAKYEELQSVTRRGYPFALHHLARWSPGALRDPDRKFRPQWRRNSAHSGKQISRRRPGTGLLIGGDLSGSACSGGPAALALPQWTLRAR